MKNTSLKYIDYTKRRLNILISGTHVFFNPVVYGKIKVHQVQIKDNEVWIYDGKYWLVTIDEDLICEILARIVKPDVQKEIDYPII